MEVDNICGICGIKSTEGVDKRDIKTMMKELAHRGPDGKGIFIDDGIGLGHTRLAILDLSERGNQPMTDGDHTIVFNGEIYNYLEIKETLVQQGERFNSSTDTEVLLKSWKRVGDDSMCNGMWAYAIWDSKHKKLTLSRDQFGIKPLYYFTFGKDDIAFASELKALVKVYEQLTGKELRLNMMKVANFFANIKMEHTKETFIKGIYKLPTYYKLPRFRYDITPEGFKKRFDDALNIRMRSDVEIGSCLSGGLDSSSIVCSLIKNENIEKMHTFSACYYDDTIDERPFMNEIIGDDKIIPHQVFPTIETLRKEMDKLIYYQDEPFETTTILAQWCVMKEAKRHGIKVLLDGQGADEILAGYIRYKWLVSNRPQDMVRGLLWKSTKIRSEYRKLREWDVPKEIWQYTEYPDMQREGFSRLENKLHEDVVMSLPRLLRYEDRNSMAHGIEARVPFLDFDLVHYCFCMSDKWKINNGWTKYILRESMKGVLPEKIRLRKDKIGFWTPHKLWMNELRDDVECAVDEFKLFDARPYFEKYYSGKKDYQYTLWKVFHLSRWIPMFVGDYN